MKAWKILNHGEALSEIDGVIPIPGPLQALIRVEAVGLNHLDLWVRNGVPGHKFPLPITPGGDIAGVIEKFGEKLGEGAETLLAHDSLSVGSPVLINPGLSCGRCEACLGGFDPLCHSYGILGESQDGGCAEYVVVPIANLIARPKNISAVEGASLAIPFITAWSMLTRKVHLQAGETILIHAGGSGVSVAAIQMAKLLGATVITTVGSEEKEKKARALGADYVVQYKKMPFRNEVKKILSQLGKRGCEVVLDHVGADTFQDSLKCLAWGGRFVTCGATSGGEVNLDLKAVFFKNISIHGSTMGSKSDFLRVIQLVSNGKLKPVVDQIFPMKDLPQAFARLESRQAFGKIILETNL